MRKVLLAATIITVAFMLGRLTAQDSRPTCNMCPSTYVSNEEILDYLKVPSVDQQIRSVDIGKTRVQVAVSYRGKLDKPAPNSVAEHSQVTEVYHVLSGSATNVTGPDLIDSVARARTNNAVVGLNGPGHNASGIRNGATQQLKAGDVLVIPAGTGHQFTKIDDHISYIMIRVDPDKVVPLMDEAASKAYLAKRPAR
jgi:mannose-6-phosphate isomerase-like protein (cupin superfamily)